MPGLEELAHNPDWHFYGRKFPSKESILEARDRMFAKHPNTTFISGSMAQSVGERAVENAAPWKSPKAGLSHCAWKSRNRSGISTFSTAPATTV